MEQLQQFPMASTNDQSGVQGFASVDSRWRDLLPLPLIEADDKTSGVKPSKKNASTSCYRRQLRRHQNLHHANEVITALNEMGGHHSAKAGAPTVAQLESQKHILSQMVSLPRSNE